MYHVFKNGWEDKKYLDDRVWGMDKVREEVLAKWTPDKVFEASGVDEATCLQVAKTMAENRPSTLVWCVGHTQHTIGNAMVRVSCLLQLALGNIGKSGGGANIFRGHDNVQGITDVGMNPDSLPGYYGIAEGSFRHFAAAWGVDFEWIKKQYAPGMMTKPGLTISRWFDAVLEKPELIDQEGNLRGMFYWGHAPNSQTRGPDLKRAMDKLDLLVVVDPFPSATAAMAAMPGKAEDLNPKRAVYLLPACTQFETSGSVTASNRSLQWREKVMDPLYESRSDHMIMYQLAQKLGFGNELVKNYKMQKIKGLDEPLPEDILREINKSVWTIGYTGQSPERLKAHMRNMNVFDADHAARQGRHRQGNRLQARRRVFRSALAVLRHAGDEAPGHAHPVRPVEARDGGRRQLPRELRRRARRAIAARGRRLALAGLGHHHRLPRVRPPAAEKARLVG